MINLNQTVNDVLSRWPAAVSVFMKYHLSCIGCSMNHYDTLREVISIYSLSDTDFIEQLCFVMSNDQVES